MGDRLEDRLHARSHRLPRSRLQPFSGRIDRKSPAKSDQFVDFGRAAERVEICGECRVVSAVARYHQRAACQLIDAPVARIESRPQCPRPRPVIWGQRQISLAYAARRKTDSCSEHIGVGRDPDILDGAAKPGRRIVANRTRNPLISQGEKALANRCCDIVPPIVTRITCQGRHLTYLGSPLGRAASEGNRSRRRR